MDNISVKPNIEMSTTQYMFISGCLAAAIAQVSTLKGEGRGINVIETGGGSANNVCNTSYRVQA